MLSKKDHMDTLFKSHSSLLVMLVILMGISILGCKDKQSKPEEVELNPTKTTKVEEQSTETGTKSILCFGNSLTAGYGLDEDLAWPTLLQQRLDSLNMDYSVINAGLSGETTAGGAGRIDWVLNQKADIFFLELGANDMLRGLDVMSTKDNLKKILDKVNSKFPGIPIVIAGMLAPPNMGKEYEKKFNAIFSTLAKEYNATLIPFFLEGVAGDVKLNLKDGKHPNAEGQKIVLENVWKAMSPLL